MRNSWLIDIMEANRGGERKGIYTVDSQNSTVQEANLRQALADNSPALFEICADMLDPHGQSGKMIPDDFIANISRVCICPISSLNWIGLCSQRRGIGRNITLEMGLSS